MNECIIHYLNEVFSSSVCIIVECLVPVEIDRIDGKTSNWCYKQQLQVTLREVKW